MKKILHIFLGVVVLLLTLYAVLWLQSRQTFPLTYGVSFSHRHAAWLGLDWKKTYLAILNDLRPNIIRLSAFWEEVEPDQDRFDFSSLDWMMGEARKHGTNVLLTVGQKSPRWPECYVPVWARRLQNDEYERRLLNFVEKIVERYRAHPALEIWQVENEPYIKFDFGDCAYFDSKLFPKEVSSARSLDPSHRIATTDSGELGFWKRTHATGDIFGTTVYRVVQTPRGWYLHYRFLPPGFYYFKSRILSIPYGDFIISELQAEPWIRGGDPRVASISEQERSLNSEQLKKNIEFARHVGASRAYLWGAEWWYWMKETKGDARYWQIIKELLAETGKQEKLDKF